MAESEGKHVGEEKEEAVCIYLDYLEKTRKPDISKNRSDEREINNRNKYNPTKKKVGEIPEKPEESDYLDRRHEVLTGKVRCELCEMALRAHNLVGLVVPFQLLPPYGCHNLFYHKENQ